MNKFSLPYDLLGNVFFSLFYSKNTECNTYNIQSMCSLFIVIGNASVSSRLLVVKYLGNQTLYVDFQLHWGGAGVTPVLFQVPLYLVIRSFLFFIGRLSFSYGKPFLETLLTLHLISLLRFGRDHSPIYLCIFCQSVKILTKACRF